MDAPLPDVYTFTAEKERPEYSPLSQADTNMYVDMVQDEIEFLFMNVRSNRSGSYRRDEDSFLRQTFLDGRALPIERDEPVWLYDTSADDIVEFTPAFNQCHLHVELRHMNFFEHPTVNEEYAVKFEKWVAGSSGPFVTFYRFVHYKGNTWQAQVERNDLDPFLEGVEPSRYIRTMTAYDFRSFFVEMEEVEQSYIGEAVHATVSRGAV